jgi:predicted alpha/beta-fold hydrolase
MTLFVRVPRRRLAAFAREEERRIVRVDDRTSVRIGIDRPSTGAPKRALVLIHGLVGSSESQYVLGTARKAVDAGFLVARVNARNCGKTEELTEECYHGGQTEELEAVARELVEREGVTSIHLVGFSIGANQVLRLAARWGHLAPKWLSGVCAVSPCIDFAASTANLRASLFNRLIEWRFMREMKSIVRRRHELSGGAFSIDGIESVRTVLEFDERFTGPLAGFSGADEYYEATRMRGRLGGITVPTLLIAAQDDPLIPFHAFDELLGNESEDGPVRMLAPERGGHVTFMGGRPARAGDWVDVDRRWAENRVVQFAVACERG